MVPFMFLASVVFAAVGAFLGLAMLSTAQSVMHEIAAFVIVGGSWTIAAVFWVGAALLVQLERNEPAKPKARAKGGAERPRPRQLGAGPKPIGPGQPLA